MIKATATNCDLQLQCIDETPEEYMSLLAGIILEAFKSCPLVFDIIKDKTPAQILDEIAACHTRREEVQSVDEPKAQH